MLTLIYLKDYCNPIDCLLLVKTIQNIAYFVQKVTIVINDSAIFLRNVWWIGGNVLPLYLVNLNCHKPTYF